MGPGFSSGHRVGQALQASHGPQDQGGTGSRGGSSSGVNGAGAAVFGDDDAARGGGRTQHQGGP